MKVHNVSVGPLQSNCYIVYDEATYNAVIIDPGDEPEKILRILTEKKLTTVYLVCTHGHFDHVGAVSLLKEKTRAKIAINKGDLAIYLSATDQAAFWEYEISAPPEPDMFVAEGDVLTAGKMSFHIFHTPGHSPGGICLYCEGIVFTGDTVFAGSVGRTDFPGGSMEELKKSFMKILSLPPQTKILPGHGGWTTVKEEKETNFFMNEVS